MPNIQMSSTSARRLSWDSQRHSSPSSYSHFYVGLMYNDMYTPPCNMAVHFISLYFVHPSSFSSVPSFPSPSSPSFLRTVFLSPKHMPIPLQPSFLNFLCDFPHFRCPSYSFIYYCPASQLRTFVVAFSILRPPISFPVPSAMPMPLPVHQCWSYHCYAHLLLDLHLHSPVAQHSRHSLPVLPPALRCVGDFRIQFYILRQRISQLCECLHSLQALLPLPVNGSLRLDVHGILDSQHHSSSSSASFPTFMWGRCVLRRLLLARSCASSPDNSRSDKSFLTLSNHLSFGLPLLLFPDTSNPITPLPMYSSSLLNTWPYHFNLLSCTFSDISPTFVVPLILSFLIMSRLVTPLIHLNILISATSNFFSCGFSTAHVSAPYIIAGLTNGLYRPYTSIIMAKR